MTKGTLFAMGSMAGIVLVLFGALVVQQAPSAQAQTAMGEGGAGLVVATGGITSATNDLFWVLYKRTPSEAEKKLLGRTFEGDRLTLCTYRALPGTGANQSGRVALIAARDITYDLKMVGLDPDTIKNVKDIKAAYEKATENK